MRTDVEESTLRATLGRLHAVLYEDKSKDNVIRVCHPSFLDFLDKYNWTDSATLHRAMFDKSFSLMGRMLRFNICELETSYVANADITDLAQRTKEKIPESLRYSCLYWATHLTEANCESVAGLITEFLGSLQLLYWFEVLGLVGGVGKGIEALRSVAEIYEVRCAWLQRCLS